MKYLMAHGFHCFSPSLEAFIGCQDANVVRGPLFGIVEPPVILLDLVHGAGLFGD